MNEDLDILLSVAAWLLRALLLIALALSLLSTDLGAAIVCRGLVP